MQITVLLFATLKDLAGVKRLDLTLSNAEVTLDTVRRALIEQFPQLEANLLAANAAINEEFSFGAQPIQEGDEVAFFPSVSGGQGEPSWPEICRLASEPVDHDEVIASITTPATGAVVIFSGIVRGQTAREGHLPHTQSLEYEAYEPMAIGKMKQVVQEIRVQYPYVQGVAIVQRVGPVAIGQNTILIACSSGHRDEGCFEAARYGINRLKEIVPVWKKELGPNGEKWIEGDYRPTPDDRQQS